MPDEDQGYFFSTCSSRTPRRCSARTPSAAKVEEILAKTKGVQYYNTIAGFSLLSYVSASYNAFFFVSLEPWDEREGAGLVGQGADRQQLNGALPRRDPGGDRVRLPAARHPRPRHRRAASRSGCRTAAAARSTFLDENLQKFLEAARKRPELQNVNSTFRAAVPQVFVDVDRDKALKQGVPIGDVYQTLQAFLGGSFVNQFNRFGRQWRVYPAGRGGGAR